MTTTQAYDFNGIAGVRERWDGSRIEDAARGGSGGEHVIEVDCGRCELAGSEACDDCLVSFVIGQPGCQGIAADAEESTVVRLLSGAGLVPALRHLPRTG